MSDFFKAYKNYIIHHPKKAEYKPTADKAFDRVKLYDVYKKIVNEVSPNEDDCALITDFTQISQYLHDLYEEMYKHLNADLCRLNMKGIEVAEFLIACLNREYKVIWKKKKEAMEKAKEGTYLSTDMFNFKLQSPMPDIGMLDARASLEAATDSYSLIMNYLRHFLDKKFEADDAKEEEFAGRLIRMFQITEIAVVFKHSYDDILYNNGFVKVDNENKSIVFDYDSHENLILLRAGDMMFAERRLHVLNSNLQMQIKPRLYRHVTDRRIKRAKIENSVITLEFGQGNAKVHKEIVADLQASIDAFYEFLQGDTVLPQMANATVDEAISVWGAIQYIAMYVSTYKDYDVALYRKEDFRVVPSRIHKEDLIEYVVKLTNIRAAKVKMVVSKMEADWKRFNDIWTSMIYPAGDYYLLPFYPILYSSPYNVIDQMMLRGGVDLDNRGKLFEKYLYQQLTEKKTSFPVVCLPAGVYGANGDCEEIDVVVSMKNVVLVADAKCIHYSVEPINYAEAWGRLEEGCEQAARKADFIRNHPEHFYALGDCTNKKFIPFVITNYPTFTGFSHNGIYVIDSHSFLAYMQGGYITMRQLDMNEDPIIAARRFYQNEDQYSDNFEAYLKKNPIKEIFKKRILIRDLPLMPDSADTYKVVCKSAEVINDPQFNIS